MEIPYYICTMKRCYKCKETKELDQFYTYIDKASGKQRVMSKCKNCDRKKNSSKSVSNYRKKLYIWFDTYKRSLSCIECGMSFKDHPWRCDFHHRDPSTKSYGISMAVSHAKSMKLLLAELPKCDPLCANCHRDRHYQEKDPGTT